MSGNNEQIVASLVDHLEQAWNRADGAGFAQPFAEDADFVNIRGEHARSREAIARGHQVIFDTIYKGSVLHSELADVRRIAPSVLLAHVKSTLRVPAGPLAGEHRSLFTAVLVANGDKYEIAAFHNTLVV